LIARLHYAAAAAYFRQKHYDTGRMLKNAGLIKEFPPLMPLSVSLRVIHRRDVLAGAGAAAALALLTGGAKRAAAEDVAPRTQAFKDAYAALVRDATPTRELISLDLPEYAENGNGVSFMLAVESPMTESDHVKALHLLSTANPQPVVATYRFTPACGRAQVTGRMRLASTQDVIAVAELSDGRFVVGERTVSVSINGCDT
jgi:sulfur-oxidizing protein SoxY